MVYPSGSVQPCQWRGPTKNPLWWSKKPFNCGRTKLTSVEDFWGARWSWFCMMIRVRYPLQKKCIGNWLRRIRLILCFPLMVRPWPWRHPKSANSINCLCLPVQLRGKVYGKGTLNTFLVSMHWPTGTLSDNWIWWPETVTIRYPWFTMRPHPLI